MTIDPRRQPVREYEEVIEVELPLDDTSRVLAGLQLEEKLATLELINLNFAEVRKQHKERIGGIWDEIRELRSHVRKGTRKEPLKVKRLMNHIAGEVTIKRADTGAVIEQRKMTLEEKQVDLL